MRKITSESVNAFEQGRNYRKENMEVTNTMHGSSLLLFGFTIAKKDGDTLLITAAGRKTATTKERLNAIIGVHIQQKAGIWYLNGKEWSGAWVKVNQNSGEWFYTYSGEWSYTS